MYLDDRERTGPHRLEFISSVVAVMDEYLFTNFKVMADTFGIGTKEAEIDLSLSRLLKRGD